MKVEIVPPTAALEAIEGAAVIFDVFRASNTVLAFLAAGAKAVALVAEIDSAVRLKAEHPDWLLAGERGGRRLPGFEADNSPAGAARLALMGRRVILTTSAGTQAAHRLCKAGPVFYGSFANAAAVADALACAAPKEVSLIPMGLRVGSPALEDDLAADWLRQRLLGGFPDYSAARARLLACDGARRLLRLGQNEDLAFCTALDTHRLVPEVIPGDPPWARVFTGACLEPRPLAQSSI